MSETPLPQTGWHRHEVEQAERWLALTYAQRLEWLWQAKQFARRALGAARPGVDGTPGEGEGSP